MMITENDRILCTHAAVRLRPPTVESEERWFATNLLGLRRFAMSPLASMVLVAFMGGCKVSKALSELTACTGIPEGSLEQLVISLEDTGLLVPPHNPEHCFALEILQKWTHYGWVEAADHHLATFDYPFLDYSEEGRMQDVQRMRQYVQVEPDTNRTKRYETATERVYTPTAKEALDGLPLAFKDVWQGNVELEPLNAERLQTLFAIVFGKLRSRRISDNGKRLDLIRKTSPSGGSRHPTEGYAMVQVVPGMSSGVYHFSVEDNSFEKIGDSPAKEDLPHLFSGPLRASFQPRVFVILTSVFGRNMYRYREPRTFRTIFMDIGHICATLEITARGLGLQCFIQHGVHDEQLEKILGLHKLSEGVVYGAALGGKGD